MMKRLFNTLIKWLKEQFGDILKTVRDFDGKVKEAKEKLIQNNSVSKRENLHEFNAKYIRYLKLEGTIMKQKSQLHWFKEGDINSKFFHYLITVRRRRLFIHKIHDNEEWIQGYENIGKAACEFFQELFT